MGANASLLLLLNINPLGRVMGNNEKGEGAFMKAVRFHVTWAGAFLVSWGNIVLR